MKIKYLKRQRINQALSAIYDYPLTIVEAPMGYGKTTAVRNFLKKEKRELLWVTIQSANDASAFFWDRFTDEISKLDKKVGKALKSLGLPLDTPQIDKVIALLNGLECEEQTVIVLDDYHLVKDLKVNNVISKVTSEKVENLHLVIITRDTTDLNIWELMSKGLCEVISQQTLKFTEDEMREYCLMMMEQVSESDLKKISEYTDGWVSLIYMLLIALEKGIPVGMNMAIDVLIKETLFKIYNAHIQDFLLKLSIMDSFTAQQARYVVQDEKAHHILQKLHKENSFVYYDEINQTYKIHNVLLDFLRMEQHFKEEELQELYRRLGEWYLEKMAFPKAYSCFKRAGDNERILEHLNHPENIRNEMAEFEGSFEMFESMPRELLYQYPIAYLQHILICLLRGNEEMAIECIKKLQELERVYKELQGIKEGYRNRVLAEINIIKKLTSFNYVEVSSAANDLILELLNGEQSYIMQGDNEFTFGSPHLLYCYFREQGSFKRILDIIVAKFPVYSKYANGCGTGSEYLALAEYSLETGAFQEAELNSFKAIYKARTKNQHSIIICANFNLIRLYILQDKVKEAIKILKQLEKEIIEVNNSIYNTTIDLCKGYIYASLGQIEKIPYWLQIGEMTTADLFYQGIAFNYLVYGKAVTASKNYIKLEMLSESFISHFSIYSNQLGFIHNSIFDAIAKYQLYGMQEGVKALKKALEKGREDNIIMPFVEYAPHIIDILEAMVADTSDCSEHIKRVLHCSRAYIKSIKSKELLKVGLTQREKEVLLLYAEGLTREQVASRLFLSDGTIKKHLQNIYQKFEVTGKVAAINIAKANGLI